MSIILKRFSARRLPSPAQDQDEHIPHLPTSHRSPSATTMNGSVQQHQLDEPEHDTYSKPILLDISHSPMSKRSASVDSYGTSDGTSLESSPEGQASGSVHDAKMDGNGAVMNGGKGDDSIITVAPASDGGMDSAENGAQESAPAQTAEPESVPSKPSSGALAGPFSSVGGALAPAAGPLTPPALIIPGTLSLPNSPDMSKLPSIQTRRLTIPVESPTTSPVSPLSGRRGLPRPAIGAMPSLANMRVTPAVLLTPAISRPLTLFPLPPVTLASAPEEPEQAARRARRNVPVLMSPGIQQDPEDGGTSSPGTSDDEGDESDGTSEEGTSTEGDARSTRSSSDGSSNAVSESPDDHQPPIRPSIEGGATSSTRTAHQPPRHASPAHTMTSLAAAMAPLTRPTIAIHESPLPKIDVVRPEGTPTPGPNKAAKNKERDYFTSKIASTTALPDRSPLQTPKPSTSRPRGATDADARPRPGLYHQVSRSLMDLTADTRKEVATAVKQLPPSIPEYSAVVAVKPVPVLKRRTSLPSINPPAYSPPHPLSAAFRTSAREEEGREKLPAYACAVHIEGTLQRKMEFSAPGIQARDRSWKKYWFELHGTALKVFKHDLRKVPVKGYKAWDGKGCFEGGKARHVVLPPGVHEDRDKALALDRARSRLEEDRRARRSSTASVVDARRPSTTSAMDSRRMSNTSTASASHSSRASSIIAPPSSFNSSRQAFNSSTTSLSSSPTTSSMNGTGTRRVATPQPPSPPYDGPQGPSASEKLSPHTTGVSVPALRDTQTKTLAPATSSNSLRHPHLPSFHTGNAMLRHYTLQGAESGLGADYKKRKNVIRVRAEGEQFLLQAETLMDVVNWIEAFQAATNVSMDLDERPMPKLPTLPRRRRRRRPPQDGASGSASAAHPVSHASANAGTSAPHSAASTSRS